MTLVIESDVKEIVIRYYGENFMRSLDANDIMMRAIRHFPKLERLVFETMTDAERDQAALMDRDGIVQVRNRCFVYAQIGQERHRLEFLENEIERANV